ncbi:hypothetical protein BpHYR1_036654 [Brachionus plicatilis]|uniref:Uncharacterized protein n=1 Tax=Brachionus plicatilis TaxID=10195 RepID=A0A3M7SND1_BRAPC|nr:hypothetical protein BpHYR1_036654 [Brachionus plicatilis]
MYCTIQIKTNLYAFLFLDSSSTLRKGKEKMTKGKSRGKEMRTKMTLFILLFRTNLKYFKGIVLVDLKIIFKLVKSQNHEAKSWSKLIFKAATVATWNGKNHVAVILTDGMPFQLFDFDF